MGHPAWGTLARHEPVKRLPVKQQPRSLDGAAQTPRDWVCHRALSRLPLCAYPRVAAACARVRLAASSALSSALPRRAGSLAVAGSHRAPA